MAATTHCGGWGLPGSEDDSEDVRRRKGWSSFILGACWQQITEFGLFASVVGRAAPKTCAQRQCGLERRRWR